MGVSLYNIACLEPPFLENDLGSLFKAIQYKTPKPIHTCYSPKLNEFIFKLLVKQTSSRPLVTEILEWFPSFSPQQFSLAKGREIDQQNFAHYQSYHDAFTKKRRIEGHTYKINNEFKELKRRINAKSLTFTGSNQGKSGKKY